MTCFGLSWLSVAILTLGNDVYDRVDLTLVTVLARDISCNKTRASW